MPKPEPNSISIDAVVTWVDGADPIHKHKRQAALNQASGRLATPIAAGRDPTRFQDNGELRYCLASIRKFAPWIRHIHLVTDHQKPNFLKHELIERYRIRYVNHEDIFESCEWALPTFNSRTIETALWRIPGITDRFLYLNDDFIITRDVSPTDFFLDKKVVLRGAWRRLPHFGSTRIHLNQALNFLAKILFHRTRTMHPLAQINAAHLVGLRDAYFHTPHVPHPIHTNTLSQYYAQHPESFTKNIGYQFRDFDQYWPIGLADHLEIVNNNAVLVDTDGVSAINGEQHSYRYIQRQLESVRLGQTSFLCISGLERISPETRKEIRSALETLLRL